MQRGTRFVLVLMLGAAALAPAMTAALELAVDTKEAPRGEAAGLAVHLGEAVGVGGVTFELAYDGSRLELLEVTPGPVLADGIHAANPEFLPSVSGRIRVSAVVPAGFSGDGTLLTLNFGLPDSASGDIPVVFAAGGATLVDLSAAAVELRDGGFRVGTAVTDAAGVLPASTRLLYNYPNPFNAGTQIPFQLARDGAVTVDLYSIDGRRVRRLDLGHRTAGYYAGRAGEAAFWDGRDQDGRRAASGVYICVLRAGAVRATQKLTLVK